MATRKLAKSEWTSYFDRVSKTLAGTQVEIEVASLQLGDQVETGWVRLNGLTYDPRDDAFDVFTEALDHRIARPKEIYVDESGDSLESVEAIDEQDRTQIIRLKSPLLLPG